MIRRRAQERARRYAEVKHSYDKVSERSERAVLCSEAGYREGFLAGHRSRDAEVRELVEGLSKAVYWAEAGGEEVNYDSTADLDIARALLARYEEDGDASR